MTIVFNFAIIILVSIFMFELFLQMQQIFVFSYDSCFFVNGIIFFCSKLIIFFGCPFYDSQTFFLWNLHLCIHHACFLYHQIFISQTFNTCKDVFDLLLWMQFSKLFLHSSVLLNERFEICVNRRSYFFIFLILIKI